MGFDRLATVAAFVGLICLGPATAEAHPHVFVDAKTGIVFDPQGRFSAVRNIWQFDETFSDFAIQGLDKDGNGNLSPAELKPLADLNIKSLKEFLFFTYLADGNQEAKFLYPKEYHLEFHGGQLTLFFTLPLETPMAVDRKTVLEIFDPEYFVAFTFVKNHPIALDQAPKGCSAAFHPPRELDAQTMATLAAIPIDQHDLPPGLVQMASALANSFTIACK